MYVHFKPIDHDELCEELYSQRKNELLLQKKSTPSKIFDSMKRTFSKISGHESVNHDQVDYLHLLQCLCLLSYIYMYKVYSLS